MASDIVGVNIIVKELRSLNAERYAENISRAKRLLEIEANRQIRRAFAEHVSPTTGRRWKELSLYTEAKKRSLGVEEKDMMERTGETKARTSAFSKIEGNSLSLYVRTTEHGYYAGIGSRGGQRMVIRRRRARALYFTLYDKRTVMYREIWTKRAIIYRRGAVPARKYFGVRAIDRLLAKALIGADRNVGS